MISFILFILSALLLMYEGKLIVLILAGQSFRKCEQYFIGFMLGVFVNALIFFLCIIFSLPINFVVIYITHILIVSALVFVVNKERLWFHFKPYGSLQIFESGGVINRRNILMVLVTVSIVCKLLFSLSHALFVPSYYYDTLSQWNTRAKISYEDRQIAFDLTEVRGHSKPQYPILVHSLQIYFNQPQADWNDHRANASTLLLSISAFAAFVLILARITSPLFSFVCLGLFMMIPLVPLHLSQGYGDIHVIEYLLVGILCTILYIKSKKDYRALIISALLVAASSWVKMDGLILGVIPFIFVFSFYFLYKCRSQDFKQMLHIPVIAFFLSILWPILLLIKGLPLSPHPEDLAIKLHTEAIIPIAEALFSYGSFGIFWFLVPIFIIFQIYEFSKSKSKCDESALVLLFGLIVFVESLVIFIFTPNVQYLLNGQTFSRTMLIPLFIMILSLVLFFYKGSSSKCQEK